MFSSIYIEQRIQKAEAYRQIGINPYTSVSGKDCSCADFLSANGHVEGLEDKRDVSKDYCVAGRIKFLRHMGKAAFAKVEDESGILQIYFSKDDLGEEEFGTIKKLIEVGDIVEAKGFAFITKTGELSLHTKRLRLLTKAVSPLPEKFHGLTDMDMRYRQRYLDLIMNREVMDVFKMRSRIVSHIRRFFEDEGFLEVETPMLHPVAGGANARPFITHHNTLGEDRFLRIAPELYLKRLIVGGFEAVFEINRNFRNEGMDHTHNPEFTMIEFYRAYYTYTQLMSLTEKLFGYLLQKLDLPMQLGFDEHTIDFSAPFKKVAYLDAIREIGGVPQSALADVQSAKSFLKISAIEVKNIDKLCYGELMAEMFDNFVEKKLINPTFITQFPIEISPLAKRNEQESHIADRFELFIAGREIANGFNELNDPVDQYERFKAQVDSKNAGNDEACDMDEDFIHALMYGMPPTAGEGIGIDRLVMLLTNQHSIKDVLLFPAMRSGANHTAPKEEKE